jgi:hypothetical protein
MPFTRFPIMMVLFFLLFAGGKILPFLFIAFGLWFALSVARHAYRFEPAPTVTPQQLTDLRTDVAASLLNVDDVVRQSANREARSRFEAAGRYYAAASAAIDRGVRRRDRDAVARDLYAARYELEATAAALEGRPMPEPPEAHHKTAKVMVAPRPNHRRCHSYCGW